MELYNEFKDKALQLIISAYNDAVNNEKALNKKELYNQLRQKSLLDQPVEQILEQIFVEDSDNPNNLLPITKTGISVIPSHIEKEWLVGMLNDTRVSFMLSPQLKDKLTHTLSDISMPADYWQQKNWQYTFSLDSACFHSKNYTSFFRTALKALQEHYYLYYESHDLYGNQYKGTAAPYKIEYCSNTNIFNLIFWNEEKSWTFKSDFNNITNLYLLPKHFSPEITKAADKYISDKKSAAEPIILQLNSKHSNALERCCNMFEEYDKELSRIESNTYKLKIFYHDHFDIKEIKEAILSLGSAVIVISPQKLRDEIIADIKNSFTR